MHELEQFTGLQINGKSIQYLNFHDLAESQSVVTEEAIVNNFTFI